jgi:anti-sigma B factor antagonist
MERIEISSERLPDGIQVVRPKGRLDVFSYLELKQVLERLNAATSDLRVVVDLSATDYIASSGWSVLLSRRRNLKVAGGDLSICGLTEETRRIYDSMKIQSVLPVAETVSEAAQLLA